VKVGDAVQLRHVPGHPNRCLRIFDVPKDFIPDVGKAQKSGLKRSDIQQELRFRKVIDKLWAGEIGVVLEFQDDLVRILTPRGVPGWLNPEGLEVLSETR